MYVRILVVLIPKSMPGIEKANCNLQVGQAITLVPMGRKPRREHQVEFEDVHLGHGLGALCVQKYGTLNSTNG